MHTIVITNSYSGLYNGWYAVSAMTYRNVIPRWRFFDEFLENVCLSMGIDF